MVFLGVDSWFACNYCFGWFGLCHRQPNASAGCNYKEILFLGYSNEIYTFQKNKLRFFFNKTKDKKYKVKNKKIDHTKTKLMDYWGNLCVYIYIYRHQLFTHIIS